MKNSCGELSPSPVRLTILSQFTVTNNECYQKKSTLPYKKHRKLNTGVIGVKSFEIEQILLAKRWTLQKHEIAWNIKQKTFSRWSATTNRGKNRNCITPVPFNGELGLPRFTTLPVLIHRWIRTTQVLIHRWNKTPSVNEDSLPRSSNKIIQDHLRG